MPSTDQLRDYRRKRRAGKDAGARREGREGASEGPEGADLRHPAPPGEGAPLRPAPRARRRARQLGRAERHAARARPAAPRGARRRPSARVRGVRGRDPEGRVRRRDRGDLGPRHVRAAGGEEGRRPDVPARRRAPPGNVGPHPGASLRPGEELAGPPQARRGRGAEPSRGDRPLPADAGDARQGAPPRRRLAVRAEVGRLSRARVRARR